MSALPDGRPGSPGTPRRARAIRHDRPDETPAPGQRFIDNKISFSARKGCFLPETVHFVICWKHRVWYGIKREDGNERPTRPELAVAAVAAGSRKLPGRPSREQSLSPEDPSGQRVRLRRPSHPHRARRFSQIPSDLGLIPEQTPPRSPTARRGFFTCC